MRGLWLLVVIGCAEPSTPFFARGGITFGEEKVVYMGPARMDFGRITLPLPTHFYLDNTDVLKPSTGDPCMPGLAGVQLYPAVAAVGDNPKGLIGQLTTELPGPALLRLRSSYAVPFECGTSTSLSATTTYSFMPNGRITRVDESVVGSIDPLSTSAACSCTATAENFRLTSFWAFARGDVYDSMFMKRAVTDAPACIVIDGTYTLGVKYVGSGMTAISTSGLTLVEQTLPGGGMQNWPSISPARAESLLAIELGADAAACTRALAKLETPGGLFVNEQPIGTDSNGIYMATAMRYDGPVTLRVAVANTSGIALAIDLGGAQHVRVRYNDRDSDSHLVQAFGEHVLFFFPGLEPEHVITIEPLD